MVSVNFKVLVTKWLNWVILQAASIVYTLSNYRFCGYDRKGIKKVADREDVIYNTYKRNER